VPPARPETPGEAPPSKSGAFTRFRTPFQIAVTVLLGLVLPYLGYWWLDSIGHDITSAMYLVVVLSLAITGGLIWIEGLFALQVEDPPEEPAEPYPAASAIIAAYLPNEAATILETVDAFLRVEYPAELQVIVAYNTPRPMAVEAVLAERAAADPRLVVHRVDGSTSKAQNVNSALALARGRFVGVFDADHHPDPDSFTRAWRWLSHGYEVVQGHCLARNGTASRVARTVAVEFEAIYAVAHPGRARLHGFGIFGGSNGYWRTDLLHEIRMRGSMLTEDIDSSLRVIEAGGRIRSDPRLVSRELATTTVRQIWNQRMRWAQGWFQVSMRHLLPALRSKHLTPRQKLGLFHLLAWREIYPWLSWQMFPIIAYWLTRKDDLNWFVPIFVLTSLFTLSVGPFQTWFAYRLSDPQIRRHPRWFLWYLLITSLVYTEFKNLIARVAQVKELMGEADWRVTPRSPS
jgi:cellulose synthase/poly-beta-1,6-N-acetylglucosamine synthase-like glycosyltransferase